MKFRLSAFWYAVATLVGAMVGVGFFGLPFVFQKAGFGVGLFFLISIGCVILLENLMYGEIVLRTHRRHQFVGYVNKYLGPIGKNINLFVFWVALYGALVAIIIISGDFLSNLLSFYFRFSPVTFSTIFIVIASIVVFSGLKLVSKVDFGFMIAFVLLVLVVAITGIRQVDFSSFSLFSGEFWFLPFGVCLFTLSSTTGVPLMREILFNKENLLRKAIIWGTLIPASLYLLFTFLVAGISGEAISPDAISGLLPFLGLKVVLLGSLFGFISSSNIFFNLATSLKQSLEEDFKLKDNKKTWFLIMIPPYVLFLLGIRNFIDIISLIGGVAVSVETILLIFVYSRAKEDGDRIPEYALRIPNLVLYFLMAIFASATIYTVFIR